MVDEPDSVVLEATPTSPNRAVWSPGYVPLYAADVPSSITTPDIVETPIGQLTFIDGAPDEKTVEAVYNQLDFGRGIEAFLAGMPAASIYAIIEGLDGVGVKRNRGIGITAELMDARSLFLTPNTTTVYVFTSIDLTEGPVVLSVPPGVLGPVDDAYFRFVVDIGKGGPDDGAGGNYLFVPPYESMTTLPADSATTGSDDSATTLPANNYFVVKPRTNSLLVFFRAFVEGNDIKAAVDTIQQNTRIYPLAEANSNPVTEFVNTSGMKFNTVHANDYHFYEELDAVVQKEPADFVDPETVGLFAAIGIKKGQAFSPSPRMKAILTDAVAVGNAAARSILFASRDHRAKLYTEIGNRRQWFTAFIGGSYEFLDRGERLLDARTLFHYYATGITPAMTAPEVGTGSVYAVAVRDSRGRYFDGAKTYKITLPGRVPAHNFWSLTVYDNQTRSLLETDQKSAGIDSKQLKISPYAAEPTTIWFGPEKPPEPDTPWVQTMPGKGWNTLLRLYGPGEEWFSQEWIPGDFEMIDFNHTVSG